MQKLIISFLFSFLLLHAKAQSKIDKFISTHDAAKLYGQKFEHSLVAFPERKEDPIKWYDSLNVKWLENNYSDNPYILSAQPGEYVVVQLGVWAVNENLKNIQVHFSDLKNDGGKIILPGKLTCFNTGGINYEGKSFTKHIDVPAEKVQPLWIGIDVPVTAKGEYSGTISVSAETDVPKSLKIKLVIRGDAVINHGFNEGKRLSRLAWLNSTAGIDNKITKGYTAVSKAGNTINILGRSMKIAANGLPENIISYFSPSNQSVSTKGENIIDAPFHFIIEKENGDTIHLNPGKIEFMAQTSSTVSWKVINTSGECNVVCTGTLEYDGFADFHLQVAAKKNIHIKDIRLEISMNKDKATYMMGLDKEGGFRPKNWQWKWDSTKNQDALWTAVVNGGLRIKWKAENYVRPLVNIYYSFGPLHLPPSWNNDSRGGVHVYEKDNIVILNAYSGEREMKKNERLNYDFELLITPFKTMNKEVQFADRYYHSDKDESASFIPAADSLGANIINVHHKKDIYPYINYPYADINVSGLKSFIDKAHNDDKRVKVYYTTRELTTNLPELWAFKSLGGEVIYPGPGNDAKTLIHPNGPDQWLKYNLKENYIPAWVATFNSGKYAGTRDLSVITTPDSRLNNFYIAGLDWMVKHLNIDGIYIDDCSLDRITIRRAREILDNNRPAARIDMHSWNHFNQYAGYASCLNLYMDLFPYIDQLWIGEGRNYNTPPDYWLVEIAGIPFGLPGQMLEGGGNPWRGMVYGITNRAGWSGAPPNNIWKFWNQYHIQQKEMIGYWDENSPVKSSNDSVKVTLYKGKLQSILAVANFGNSDEVTSLKINFQQLGLNEPATCHIPAVLMFQDDQQLNSLENIHVPARKGYMIVIENKR